MEIQVGYIQIQPKIMARNEAVKLPNSYMLCSKEVGLTVAFYFAHPECHSLLETLVF